jgi:hypothetical protein
MTHSYIDVYFPCRAIAEAELGLLPFHLPLGTSHHIDQVKRRSSCLCVHIPFSVSGRGKIDVEDCTQVSEGEWGQ